NWQFRYQIAGQPRWMGLGGAGDVGLAAARAKADELRVLVRNGVDPRAEERARVQAAAAAALKARVPTFREAAEQYIEAQAPGWRNEKHAAQWSATLSTYAFPLLGDLPVDQVETDDVLKVVQPIWTTKPETASRLRGRIESVLDAARVRGWRQGENPARWKGHLAALLPAKAKVAKVEHHAALHWREMPRFWAALAEREGTAAQALRFAVLTAARSGEVRGATWREFDLAQRLWVIPEGRMKAGREHRVPLSDAALALLELVRPDQPDPDAPVFPARGSSALSDMALTALLRRMEWKDSKGDVVTAHGMRSTFRDWAGEATHHPREVIEQALAHGLKDKAEAAYARGDLLAKRSALMADWAAYCTKPASSAVIPLGPINKARPG
ncbi:MAG: tyrosine-type recombinase/integrase, partial [Roseomonas sp.]|nr:tyrosine-type recombinase/integrase [Roseomonas sp.]